MKKTFKSYLIIWAILLVLFNVIAFVSPGWIAYDKYSGSFWVGYAFIMVSFIGQLVCAMKAFRAENLQKLFYSVPLITISYTGLIVSFVVGGLCMLLSPLPYWIAAVAGVIVLVITAIAVIKADTAAELVAEVDEKIKAKTLFIKSLTVDAESLLAKAQDEETKAVCRKVYEAVRYSDPVFNEALGGVESEITLKMAALTQAVANNDAAAKALADELLVLVEDRNKQCKLLK